MPRADGGFSLVELLMVIVFISVAVLGISGLSHTSSTALAKTDDQQRIAQYVQECTERVLGAKRDLGYSYVTSTYPACSTTPATGFTLSMSGNGTNSTASPCPSGANCQFVVVSVTKGTLSGSATIMLVEY